MSSMTFYPSLLHFKIPNSPFSKSEIATLNAPDVYPIVGHNYIYYISNTYDGKFVRY